MTERSAQDHTNARTYETGDFVEHFDDRELRPAEVMILVRYREALSRRVLEIGCGAGRLLGYVTMSVESAGADQALSRLRYLPWGEQLRHDLTALVFTKQGSAAED